MELQILSFTKLSHFRTGITNEIRQLTNGDQYNITGKLFRFCDISEHVEYGWMNDGLIINMKTID